MQISEHSRHGRAGVLMSNVYRCIFRTKDDAKIQDGVQEKANDANHRRTNCNFYRCVTAVV